MKSRLQGTGTVLDRAISFLFSTGIPWPPEINPDLWVQTLGLLDSPGRLQAAWTDGYAPPGLEMEVSELSDSGINFLGSCASLIYPTWRRRKHSGGVWDDSSGRVPLSPSSENWEQERHSWCGPSLRASASPIAVSSPAQPLCCYRSIRHGYRSIISTPIVGLPRPSSPTWEYKSISRAAGYA